MTAVKKEEDDKAAVQHHRSKKKQRAEDTQAQHQHPRNDDDGVRQLPQGRLEEEQQQHWVAMEALERAHQQKLRDLADLDELREARALLAQAGAQADFADVLSADGQPLRVGEAVGRLLNCVKRARGQLGAARRGFRTKQQR